MRHHRITRPAALSLALIALAVPAASADIHHETVVGTAQAPTAAQIHDETVVGTAQSAPASAPIRDETVLRAAPVAAIRDETVLQPAQSLQSPPAPASGGFNWGDAAIGGGGLLALILLGGGTALAVVRHRRARPNDLAGLTVSGASRGGAR